MYDYRTRYARHVLEKVKEEFGENVFETVIRYNIRLREAVDYGLPVGEYDKHAIGFKDYEDLAEEVIRSEPADVERAIDTLIAAQDISYKTEEYHAGEEVRPPKPGPITVIDDYPSHFQASYRSSMADTIAAASADSIFVADDEIEEY
jgi:hypothetical protein